MDAGSGVTLAKFGRSRPDVRIMAAKLSFIGSCGGCVSRAEDTDLRILGWLTNIERSSTRMTALTTVRFGCHRRGFFTVS
jgi:hypothetical protein